MWMICEWSRKKVNRRIHSFMHGVCGEQEKFTWQILHEQYMHKFLALNLAIQPKCRWHVSFLHDCVSADTFMSWRPALMQVAVWAAGTSSKPPCPPQRKSLLHITSASWARALSLSCGHSQVMFFTLMRDAPSLFSSRSAVIYPRFGRRERLREEKKIYEERGEDCYARRSTAGRSRESISSTFKLKWRFS